MPELEDITYSRDTTVAAVRDYYNFLTKLYLPEEAIIEPPEGGWPNITPASMKALDKTDEVISLLRHLPYIRDLNNAGDPPHGAAWCKFADWQDIARNISEGGGDAEGARICSEGSDIYEDGQVPAHVVGLTSGGRDNPIFLLDTELGVIYWRDCPGEIRWDESAPREQIFDDPYEYADENEAEWRGDAQSWEITDFFEILKDQFRRLHFVPVNNQEVKDIYTTYGDDRKGMIPMVQRIYREHGWPDLKRYRKLECLRAVQKALKEHYPDEADDPGDSEYSGDDSD